MQSDLHVAKSSAQADAESERESCSREWVPNLVSIVMPSHNRQRVIAESIASVIAQTFLQWELLIVDDASSDDTVAVAQEFAASDPRIRVIPLTKNGGAANARNVGICAAKGQYLAFLDSDDLWLPDKLQAQIRFMRQKDIAFSFCSYRRFGAGARIGSMIRIPKVVGYEKLLRHNVIGCLTVLIDRSKTGNFTMIPGGYEDYYAWLQILKSGHQAWGLQQDLARYRVSTNSISGNKVHSAVLTWRTYRNLEKLPLYKAVWCFVNYFVRSIYSRMLDALPV